MQKNRSKILAVCLIILTLCLLGGSRPAQAAPMKMSKSKATLWVGDTLQLSVKNPAGKVKWSSDNKSVATVSKKGKVKAKKEGKATVTAKIGKKKCKCKLTVYKTKLSDDQITAEFGSEQKLKLLHPKAKVAWLSSNRDVAYADGTKLYAKSVGTAEITAMCCGKSYKCTVTVVSGESETLTENGVYTSKEKVSLYIHTYQTLPKNYITKSEAQALGWPGGSLIPYKKYGAIGGDRFSNYEKKLPVKSGRTYYECDIDTVGALLRGAKRLVYSDDGLIFYTEDHYVTFEQLY